jgi:hypothetical protein
MPQVTEFPPFGVDGRAAVAAITRVCKETPATGEAAREFRARLRVTKLWDAERPTAAPTFFGVGGARVVPTAFMTAVASATSADAVADAIITRLWHLNPPMAAAILERVSERPHGKDELSKFLGSSGYGGRAPSRPGLEAWLQLAIACGALKAIGIAVAPGPRIATLRALADGFELSEFLDGDAPEALAPLGSSGGDNDEPSPAATPEPGAPMTIAPESSIPQAAAAPVSPLPVALRHLALVALPAPLGERRPVPVSQFASAAPVFDDDTLGDTSARIAAWWQRAAVAPGGFAPDDFGLDAEAWVESPDELLYRVAVAAALVFRLEASRDGVIAAFRALDGAGVLADLFHGTVPDALPAQVDARALMLASLAARRCAEAPELAAELDRAASAEDKFAALDRALGRGLFRAELSWMLGQLAALGVLRGEDLASVTSAPYRLVRDTLYRLGFLPTPYATSTNALLAAARAARRVAGPPPIAGEEVVAAFALAAGCAYDCPHRKACDMPCRERLE